MLDDVNIVVDEPLSSHAFAINDINGHFIDIVSWVTKSDGNTMQAIRKDATFLIAVFGKYLHEPLDYLLQGDIIVEALEIIIDKLSAGFSCSMADAVVLV